MKDEVDALGSLSLIILKVSADVKQHRRRRRRRRRNSFKGDVGETSERRGGAHMGFSERIDTTLN